MFKIDILSDVLVLIELLNSSRYKTAKENSMFDMPKLTWSQKSYPLCTDVRTDSILKNTFIKITSIKSFDCLQKVTPYN